MTNSKHVPKRRFKEFESDGEWEFSRFGEVVVRVSESMMNSSFPNVEYEDVIPGKGQLNKNILEKTNNKKGIRFLEGDVLYGKLRPYLKNWLLSDFKGIAVGDWWVLRSSELDSKFLYNFIQTEKYQVVANRSTGTKMPRSDWETVKDSDILFPSNFEQKKLGDFFQTIDSLISNRQHKLDKLKNLKKAYLSEMFPAEGERVPKRRFPGFEGEWEWKKLGELATIVRGASPRPIQDPKWFDSESEVGWLRISDVTEQNGRIYKLSQRLSSLGQEKTRVVSEPHLILSIAATVGKPVINYVRTGIHDGFLIFQEPKFEIEYMYYLLGMFRKNWAAYGQPGSQLNLNSDIVKEQRVAIPSQSEQVEISKFFKKLDQSITLQQQKLDKLNDLKKAYLNELFV